MGRQLGLEKPHENESILTAAEVTANRSDQFLRLERGDPATAKAGSATFQSESFVEAVLAGWNKHQCDLPIQ